MQNLLVLAVFALMVAACSEEAGRDASDSAVLGTDSTPTSPSDSSSQADAPSNSSDSAQSQSDARVSPGSYALPPPNSCSNQHAVQGCRKGVASSECGGVCSTDYGPTSTSACEGGKPGVPVNFACPRWLLFSDEMQQAAADDSNTSFNYGIVGHDVDTSGVDGANTSACCQCYQIVFDLPKENQAWKDPNNASSPETAIQPPPPMIVQSFNTGTAGPENFDIYMGAGGLGAHNGCFSVNGSTSNSGTYQYTNYPSDGQPNGGGIKAAGDFGNQSACKTSWQWVTPESLGSAACVEKVTNACNKMVLPDSRMQSMARRSCIASNAPTSLYHLNWHFYAMRVECPAHLTEVTGCKLAPQGLPRPDPSINTPAKASADSRFRKTAANGQRYFTTQMEDCCMPTCSWSNSVKLPTVGGYNSFYSCNQAGVPWTQ